MTDPLELLDRPSITRDRLGKLAALHLGEAEVDEAGPDLLGAPHALGERKSAAKRLGGLVGSTGVAMGISDDAERRREAAGIVPICEDALRGERMPERLVVLAQ